MEISVVICTHNRAALLRSAIQSVLEQIYPIENYELIVVDNNSADSTHTLIEEFSSEHNHVRYILETNLGLSNARNRGWQEAQGKYVGYLDDDCKVSPTWIINALRVAKEIHPEAFGGPYYAFYNTPKPKWFKDQYGSHVQGDVARQLQKNEYLDGGNMFIRRDILQTMAGFHSEFGMKGDEIAYGEETYLFDRLRRKDENAILYYDPSIFVKHLVRPEKMNVIAAAKRMFIAGQYSCRVSKPQAISWINIIKSIFGICFRLLSSILYIFARDKTKYPYYQNYIYEVLLNYAAQLGWSSAALFSSEKNFND